MRGEKYRVLIFKKIFVKRNKVQAKGNISRFRKHGLKKFISDDLRLHCNFNIFTGLWQVEGTGEVG